MYRLEAMGVEMEKEEAKKEAWGDTEMVVGEGMEREVAEMEREGGMQLQ